MATPSKSKSNVENEDLAHIRQDLDSLRNNVVALSRSLKHDVKETALTRWEKMKEKSGRSLEQAEETVREHPARSIVTAFGAGLVLSALLRSR